MKPGVNAYGLNTFKLNVVECFDVGLNDSLIVLTFRMLNNN